MMVNEYDLMSGAGIPREGRVAEKVTGSIINLQSKFPNESLRANALGRRDIFAISTSWHPDKDELAS